MAVVVLQILTGPGAMAVVAQGYPVLEVMRQEPRLVWLVRTTA
jgi:hypothetical protein